MSRQNRLGSHPSWFLLAVALIGLLWLLTGRLAFATPLANAEEETLAPETGVVLSQSKSPQTLEAGERKSPSLPPRKALNLSASEEEFSCFVKLAAGAQEPAAEVLGGLGLTVVKRFPQSSLLLLGPAPDTAAAPDDSAVEALSALPGVEWVDRGQTKHMLLEPNDPNYGQQWGLPAAGFPGAWDFTAGSEEVVVAVLDSGIAQDILDLAGKVVSPFSTLHETSESWAWEDIVGHGSGVAGVALAQGNNSWGIAGAAWNVRLMPVHFTDGATVEADDYVEAIYYAVDHGADVINISYGSEDTGPTERTAIAYAVSRGVVVVASAGNGGAGGHVQYPAALPGVIAVGATSNNNSLASFSAVGPQVDLVAPGTGILTYFANTRSWGLASQNGTSFAAPLVSGAAALLLSKYPDLTAAEVESFLERSALDLGVAGHDQRYGDGLLDAEEALRLAEASVTTTTTSTTTTTEPVRPSPFPDVDANEPYFEAIVGLSEAGVINGRLDGTFGAEDPVLRAQFAKMACGALGIPVEEGMNSSFTDLGPDDPLSLYPHEFVAAAEAEGILRGVRAGSFEPWTDIARAQLVTAVIRGMQALYPGYLTQPPASYPGTLGSFSPDHAPAMRIAEYNGLLAGLSGFGEGWDPWAPASRGEVAQILWQAMSLR